MNEHTGCCLPIVGYLVSTKSNTKNNTNKSFDDCALKTIQQTRAGITVLGRSAISSRPVGPLRSPSSTVCRSCAETYGNVYLQDGHGGDATGLVWAGGCNVRVGSVNGKMRNTSAVRSRISSKLIFASCVGYFDRAYCGFYVTSSRIDTAGILISLRWLLRLSFFGRNRLQFFNG